MSIGKGFKDLLDDVVTVPKEDVKDFGIGDRKLLLVIAGISGSGKSYLEKNLISTYPEFFNKWEQFTTRLPRPGEKESKPYIFVTEETYDRFKDCLVGRVGIDGESNFGKTKYGSVPNFEKGKISTVILSTEGILDLKKSIDRGEFECEVCIFGLDVDNSEIVQREGRDNESLERERDVLNLADYRRKRANGTYIIPDDVVKVVNEFFNIKIEK
ncbi:hypothetical protein [Proteus mirabilis]|uniref:hypothetical protein n=1 Tax=Proteus mirabilis TaxID=584 RepID=UPI0034D46964